MQGGVLRFIVKPFDFGRYWQTLDSYRGYRNTRESVAGRPEHLYRLTDAGARGALVQP